MSKPYNGMLKNMKIKLIPERLFVMDVYPNAEISKKLFRFQIKDNSVLIAEGKTPREAWQNAKKKIKHKQ